MHSTGIKSEDSLSLAEKYLSTRKHTMDLCDPLEPEDFVPQPIEDVSPARWNIAHTTWFFEEMILKNYSEGYREFDPAFGFLFNSYYNTIGERTLRNKRGDLSRPTVRQIFEYRSYVDEHLVRLLENHTDGPVADLTVLGINHEQQHQELFLTDLKYTFAQNPIDPIYREDFALVENAPEQKPGRTKIEAGLYDIGFEGDGFCFDNELSRHKVFLNGFEIENSLVTNGEYLDFIKDGGYDDHRLWHSEGWDWVRQESVSAPMYWRREPDGSYSNFTLGGRRALKPSSPVCHVSFYEAAAFAEWKGQRLPTEFEWEAASKSLEWGTRWEWTSSAYLPYPGFSVAEGAVGEYNGKFMVNQLVLRGASCATPPGHSRPTYRNFFHPHLRWQFTGIRLAA